MKTPGHCITSFKRRPDNVGAVWTYLHEADAKTAAAHLRAQGDLVATTLRTVSPFGAGIDLWFVAILRPPPALGPFEVNP